MDIKRCTYCHKLSRAKTETCSQCGHPYAENGSKVITLPPGKGKRKSIPVSPVDESHVDDMASVPQGTRKGLPVPQTGFPYYTLQRARADIVGVPLAGTLGEELVSTQTRSIPPASPHRAGHYSGLHPEDQPYQSSFMPILRPSAITRRLVEQESDEALQPIVVSSAPSQLVHESEREPTPKRYVASPISSPSPMPQRYSGTLSQKAIPIPLPEVEPPPSVPESTLHEQITAP